jgi:L-threonylcarbamoyladenylate synthase
MIYATNQSDALAKLLSGGVGVMPTDTVYGMVARATDGLAVARFYELKQRDHKPGTVIAASVAQLVELGVDEPHLRQVEQWWPNPLSVICDTGAELDYLHLGLGSLAVRVPDNEELRWLLEISGPLISTSANLPDLPSAVNVHQAQEYFQDQVDFYVDGGDLSGHAPSTIVKIHDDGVEIIRQGAADIEVALAKIGLIR